MAEQFAPRACHSNAAVQTDEWTARFLSERACRSCATNSLPTPVSPVISTVQLAGADEVDFFEHLLERSTMADEFALGASRCAFV